MENFSLTKIRKTRKEIIFTILRQKSYLKLIKKYSSNKYSYNTICINNIIYNESCLIVAKFKDFLIFDDSTEFIRKSYNKTEISNKLYKILDLYENYSKIFPNYLVVKEKKFMYKNIRKKQKMIDAFNQIKLEEEENRRKIKEKQENDKTQDNKLFTDLVKDEIKIFQKDNNIKKYKKSFDSENNKNNNDTLYGLSHSSISLNFINKKDFLSTSIKKSNDSKNINENETISVILNIMNDSKIYIKDLPNIFKVNYSISKEKNIKNNIIEKKIINFTKTKKNNNAKINYLKENKNITIYNTNSITLQKMMLTPEKRKQEMKSKNIFHFNSTLLNRKKIKMFNQNIMNTNDNSLSTSKKKKIYQKQKIYIPSIENTIININNNFFSEISKTERFENQKSRKFTSSNTNYNILQNSTRENENKLKSNKLSSTNQKFLKHKHILQEFSYKKNVNIRANNKLISYKSTKIKRKISPKIIKLNSLINRKNRNSEFIVPHLINKNNEIVKLNINNVPKSKDKTKHIIINKKENDYLSKHNSKLLTLKKKYKLNNNEFSSLSFINIAKTETNIKFKNQNKNKEKKKSNGINEKQINCFNNIKKYTILTNNFFITHRNSKEKIKKSKENKNFIMEKQKSNKSHENKNFQNSHSFKNKILKIEKRYPFKKYISNYLNKTKTKDSNGINNNFINYSTIAGKNQITKNIKNILLDSKSIEKKNKYESIDFSNSDYCIHKKFFSKFGSNKRNSYIYSPKNYFNMFLKSNTLKNNKKDKEYLIKRSILFNKTITPKQDVFSNSQNVLKNKYKSIILKKNNQKSYDFNSDILLKYNQNILNKTNNSKNANKMKIKKKFYSIDLNIINYNNKYNSINQKNKSKEKEKKNDSKDLFKIMKDFPNDNKNEEKKSRINDNQKNPFPMTIKVNTKNFLSKIKEKYKMKKQ